MAIGFIQTARRNTKKKISLEAEFILSTWEPFYSKARLLISYFTFQKTMLGMYCLISRFFRQITHSATFTPDIHYRWWWDFSYFCSASWPCS